MRLTDIAEKIDTHLKRFEASKKINKLDKKHNTQPYYNAGAYQGGNKVRVKYISYQGGTMLDKTEALRYLAWLDAGNVGSWGVCRHDKKFKMPKPKAVCAGCGEKVTSYCAFIRCGTGEVRVCAGRRGSLSYSDPYPKKSCATKARAKLALCPGCDAENTTPGRICFDCQELLNRYQGLGDNEVEGYTLDDSLIGPYLGTCDADGERQEPARDLLKLLCQIAAPEGLRRWARGGFPDWARGGVLGSASPTSDDPSVELDEGQKEAMVRIGAVLKTFAKQQRLEGFRSGGGVLQQLISGESSISDYNDIQLRAEKIYGADEEE